MRLSADGGRTYASYALAMLLAVYALNFVDRIILGILVPPIKAELHLSDTQLGLLGGTAFAIFYTALGMPIGWLADRVNRVWIIAGSLALWSAFSVGSGLVHSFGQLFTARLGVGIGEAGGVAPAYSLISDYFPPARRTRALSVYSFGIPIGSAAGLLFGGLLASSINWRTAFLFVGALGLVLAPIFVFAVREPPRGGLDQQEQLESPRNLFGKLSFWSLSLGGAMSSVIGYGIVFWLPSFFRRSYQLTLPQVSWYLGVLTLVGGILGIWASGWLADRLGERSRAAYALVPAAACALCAPLYAVGVMAPPTLWNLPMFLLPTTLALVWLAPAICAVQHLVPAGRRAFASASFLFIINLIGLGMGSLVIGWLSDHLAGRYGTESLRYAILSGTGFYLLAAMLFILAARRLPRDWEG